MNQITIKICKKKKQEEENMLSNASSLALPDSLAIFHTIGHHIVHLHGFWLLSGPED